MIEPSPANAPGLAETAQRVSAKGVETPEQIEISKQARTSWRIFIGRILAVVIPVALWFAPLNLDPTVQRALAITSFIIVAWITEALDHALTGLIGCYLYWALGVVKFETAFSGFADDTPWFLFGAVLFGTMATKSGLARRLAYVVMLRVGSSYARILLGLILSDFLLTFFVPSGIARVVIMAAVALGLMEVFGLGPGSNVGRGMFIILTYTAGIFDKMIIAGAASITARGLIEKVGQVQVLWSHWFLAYLPCDLITIFVAWRLTLWLYPPEKATLPGGANFLKETLQKMGPWSALEKRSALLMLIAISLWMTDFVHHLSPALIGLGVGLFAALPRLGVLGIEDVKRLNYLPVFFVASAVSMGQVLVSTKALDQAVKRNSQRFPDEFVFRLTQEQANLLRSQFVTADIRGALEISGSNRSQFVTGSQKHRDPRLLPYAFTEHGALMAANVLRSRRAIQNERADRANLRAPATHGCLRGRARAQG